LTIRTSIDSLVRVVGGGFDGGFDGGVLLQCTVTLAEAESST
jgi:hypothetical protein